MKRFLMWLLRAFNDWFTSAPGILHTVTIVLVIALLEQLRVVHDAHGFWLLYYLTIYSAITQPALAYVAKQSGEQQERILEHLDAMVAHLGVTPKDEA